MDALSLLAAAAVHAALADWGEAALLLLWAALLPRLRPTGAELAVHALIGFGVTGVAWLVSGYALDAALAGAAAAIAGPRRADLLLLLCLAVLDDGPLPLGPLALALLRLVDAPMSGATVVGGAAWFAALPLGEDRARGLLMLALGVDALLRRRAWPLLGLLLPGVAPFFGMLPAPWPWSLGVGLLAALPGLAGRLRARRRAEAGRQSS